MIDEVLGIIKDELDTFLKLKMKEGQGQYIQLGPIIDQDGKPAVIENSICMSLVKIEEEKTNKANHNPHEVVKNDVHFFNPPVKLNLYILFSATYLDGQEKNYQEALKRLSHVIAFFQAKNVFTAQNTPPLDPRFDKIVMELYNPTFEEQNNLWSMLGNNYRPSVLYKLRTLRVQEKHTISTAKTTKAAEFDKRVK